MSSSGGSQTQVYSDNYSTIITSAAPGGLTENTSGSSNYTFTFSASSGGSSYTYIGADDANSTSSQTLTTATPAATTTLAWTWNFHKHDDRNTSGSTDSTGALITASDSGNGSMNSSSTDNGTTTRFLGYLGNGGSVTDTVNGSSSNGSSNSHSISLNGNSSGPPTPSGTSSQSVNNSQSSSYHGGGTYIVGAAMPGMVNPTGNTTTGSGTITESGSDTTSNGFSNNASLGADGHWTVTSGNGGSTGSGFTLSSYLGNGAYGYTFSNGAAGGTWNQDGHSDSIYGTTTNATANADGSWFTTGSSHGNGSATQNSSYHGAGAYTAGTSGVSSNGSTITGGGTTTESGGSSLTTGYNSHYFATGNGGWIKDADTQTSNSSGDTHSSNTGSGGYVTPYAGGATVGTWNQNASHDSSYTVSLTAALVPAATILGALGYAYVYNTTGTASNGGSDSNSDSYNGNGAFVVSAGAITGGGTNTEAGSDNSSDNYNGSYTLDANGVWEGVNGTGSSNSFGNTTSGYNGNGVYVASAGDVNGGTWNEAGGSDTNYNTTTSSTLSAFGWTTSGGGSNGGDYHSSDSYNGAGSETLSYAGGGSPGGGTANVGAATTTESGADHASDQYSSNFTLGVNGWNQTDGTASSTSDGDTHSSFTGGGAYGVTFVGGGVNGTWNQSGGGDTNFTAQSSSTYNAGAGLVGMWVTTGSWDGGGSDNQSSNYSGSGSYDAGAGGTAPDGSTTTGGGTVSQSGGDTSGDQYSSSFTLGADGKWSGASGSGTTNSSGNTHVSYSGMGITNYLVPGGSVNENWQVTENGGTHYTMNTLSSLNADGTWATTGTGDYGGDDALLYSYSNQGYSTSDGDILEGGAGNASDTYDIHFALTAAGGWQATSGSAHTTVSGFDDHFTPSPITHTTYLHWSQSTLNADGTWTTVTDSGGAAYSTPAQVSTPIPTTSVVNSPPAFTQTVSMPTVKPSLPSAPTSLQGASQIAFDANGNLTQVTDADGNQTAFTYNAAGQVTSQTDATGATTNYAYDAQGNLTSQVDALGRRRDYTYNTAGQVLTETWTNADGSIADVNQYSYNAAGQLVTASNHEGTYAYTYNAAGQVATQTDPWGLTLTYGYDAAGNKVSVTDSLGGQTSSTYNDNGQLTSRMYTGPEVTSAVNVGLGYNANGQLATVTRSRDATIVSQSSYGYNSVGDLTSIQHQDGAGNVLASYQYAYAQNGVGNAPLIGSSRPSATAAADLIFSETDNGVTTNYGYDSQGELTTAGAITESYDAAGNRTNAGDVTGTDNRLLSDGTWNYSYDAVGNQVKKVNIATGETWTYGYDFNNRLTSAVDRVADGGALLQRVTFQYDVFGNRTEKDVTQGDGTSITRFAYDGKNAWADLDGNNALLTRHLYLDGLDQPVARISAAGLVAWYLTDHLGSVRDVVNDNGVILDHIDYNAFGAVTNETNPAKGDRFGWTGGIRDGETGLSFFDHRYYNPQTGEWTTKDPSSFRAGDANLYRYVGNNVTNATDPTGLLKLGWSWYGALGGANTGAIAGGIGGALAGGVPTLGIGAPVGALIGGVLGAVVGGVIGGVVVGTFSPTDTPASQYIQGEFLGIPAGLASGYFSLLALEAAAPALIATWQWLTTHPETADEVDPDKIKRIGDLTREEAATLADIWKGTQPTAALPLDVRQQLANLYSGVASQNAPGFAQSAFNQARADFLLGQGPNPGPSVVEFSQRMGIPVYRGP